jgi:chemotaxis protein MotB
MPKGKPPPKKASAGAPAWMVTFADLMALLLTLFVLLLSFAEMDVTRYKQLAGAMKDAFGISKITLLPGIIEIGGKPSRDKPAVVQPLPKPKQADVPIPEVEQTDKVVKPEDVTEDITIMNLKVLLSEELAKQEVEIEETADGAIVRFPEKTAFPAGTATITNEFAPMLRKLAPVIANAKGDVVVSGHTDDKPIRTERFRSNWDLSTARAVSVVHYFLENTDVDPARLTAQGFADSRPLVPNDSPENRAKNRRVEVAITTR